MYELANFLYGVIFVSFDEFCYGWQNVSIWQELNKQWSIAWKQIKTGNMIQLTQFCKIQWFKFYKPQNQANLGYEHFGSWRTGTNELEIGKV